MRKVYFFLFCLAVLSTSIQAQELQAIVSTNHVQLRWISSNGVSVDHYEIERRSRGEEFKIIALILAETGTASTAYLYKDKVTGGDQHFYYRVHCFYTDGTDSYSDILSLNLAEAHDDLLKISADASACKLLLDLPSEKGTYLFRIYNMNGQLLETQRSVAGSHIVETDKLSSGRYFMEAYHPVSGKRFYGTFSL
jgi:hypothetical protein